MTAYNAGNAYLQILPSFRGIEKLMQRETAKLARDIDNSIAQGTNDGILKAFRNVDTSTIRKSAADAGNQWSTAFGGQAGAQMDKSGRDSGERWAGAYADTVQRRLAAAIRSIPNVPMTVNTTDAERKLAAIRVEMEGLSRQTIGVDIDADEAQAKLTVLKARLDELDGKNVDIQVRTNALAASAELGAVTRSADDSDDSLRRLGSDAGITMSRLGYMIAVGASMGSLITPAAVAAAVAVAGIGVAAASAAIGAGVLALGVAGIGDAVKKMDAYQQDANKSAHSFSQAQVRVQSATEAVRNAEQSLQNTRTDSAEAAVQAQQRIADAQRNVAKAQRDSAESVRRAREQEKSAIQDVARARVDARDAIRRAVQSEEDAERSATKAVKDQRDARQDLNQALRDAVRDLAELDTAVKRNGNEIDKATTASMEAKQELDKLLTNPRATQIEKRMALEAYNDKIIQIEELKNQQGELLQQQQAAAKDGVESTDRVKSAREKLANADERAADANRRVADAQRAVSKAQIDGAQKVSDAEKRVSDARQATVKAQVDGAERVADAQRAVNDAQRAAAKQQRDAQRQIQAGVQGLTDAQRGLAQANEASGVAGGEAFDNMNDALNNLSPAAQRFAKFLLGLKPKLQALRAEAQTGLLPGLQEGIQTLVDRYLPSFEKFVGRVARGLGAMFAATSQVLSLPQWQQFFTFLDGTALPSLQGMWVMALNLARGVANIVRALNPLAAPMGQGLVDLTERFALWSDKLDTSTGFQQFLAYAKEEGPAVVHLIEEMVTFVGRLLAGMAPMGAVVVAIATAVLEWMNSWDIDTLSKVVELAAILGTAVWALTGLVRGVKFVTEAWTAVSVIAAGVQKVLAAATARFNAATVASTASTGLLNGALFRTAGAGTAAAGGMAAMSAVAGPLLLVLAGIAGIWYLQTRGQRAAKKTTDELAPALQELGKAYEEAGNNATLGGAAVTDSFRRIVSTNSDMQQAVVTLTDLGASLDTVAGAASGSAEQLDKVVTLIETRIKALQAETKANFFSIFDNEDRANEMDRLRELEDAFKKNADAAHLTNQAMTLLGDSSDNLTQSVQLLTPAEQALADAQTVLADKTSTAQQKFDALTKAQDVLRQANIDAIDASEGWEASLDSLTESVKASKAEHDKDAKSLSIHTATGRSNRDMLEALIGSADKMYDADVALNGVTADAITKGQGHYNQIRAVAKQLGLGKVATENLIKAYGKIPPTVETAIGFKKGQFDAMFQQLEQAAFIQKALKNGTDIDKARADFKALLSDRARAKNHGWSTGGPIQGAGIVGGKKADANLILASKGEFMQQADAVDYYGTDFMHAVNKRLIPREIFQGLAAGGEVGVKQKWPFTMDLSKIFVPSVEDLQAAVFGGAFTGALGGAKGGRGYKWEMAVLRKAFPGLALISGFRPGAKTLSGNSSYHSIGRAVDVPAKRPVAEWIAQNYGKNTLELITPWRDLMLWHGKHHKYSHAIEAQHGVFGNNRHIHWAYDQGGMLPEGYSTVFNGTGKPEPVLSGQQWSKIDALAGAATSGGSTGASYHFAFLDTTLDPGKLRTLQDREAILSRQGRAR